MQDLRTVHVCDALQELVGDQPALVQRQEAPLPVPMSAEIVREVWIQDTSRLVAISDDGHRTQEIGMWYPDTNNGWK